ncbi:hypothetical protein RKD38_003837 [Streptomyces ambofaciens]
MSTTTTPLAAAIGAHCAGDLVGHVEHGDVDPVEGLFAQRDDLDLLPAHGQLAAGRARGGDQADVAPDVRVLGQDLEHDRADGAGRAHDGERGPAGAAAVRAGVVRGGHQRPVPP